jgi:hypothetical protein
MPGLKRREAVIELLEEQPPVRWHVKCPRLHNIILSILNGGLNDDPASKGANTW